MVEADALQLEEDDGEEELVEEDKDAGDDAGVLVHVLRYPALAGPTTLHTVQRVTDRKSRSDKNYLHLSSFVRNMFKGLKMCYFQVCKSK